MKALATNIPKSIPIGCRLACDDNSGAKIVQVIGVLGRQGVHTRVLSAGVGDIVIVAVKKGNPKMKKKVERAVIIRQKKEMRRVNGIRVSFEDNACALVDDQYLPKGTEIKGAVCREVAERYPKVAGIAPIVI